MKKHMRYYNKIIAIFIVAIVSSCSIYSSNVIIEEGDVFVEERVFQSESDPPHTGEYIFHEYIFRADVGVVFDFHKFCKEKGGKIGKIKLETYHTNIILLLMLYDRRYYVTCVD